MSDDAVRRLIDESEVHAQLGRAARLLDAKRWDHLEEVFDRAITFDYGDGAGVRSGIDALRKTFARHLDTCGATQHLLGSVIVSVDGDCATTEAYVQARHAGVGPLATEVFDTNGEYVDTWARREDGWRMVHREVRWLVLSGNPAVLGL